MPKAEDSREKKMREDGRKIIDLEAERRRDKQLIKELKESVATARLLLGEANAFNHDNERKFLYMREELMACQKARGFPSKVDMGTSGPALNG